MLSARQTIGNGPEGTAHTLAVLEAWADHYGRLPAIRAAALLIAGGLTDDDPAAQLAALARFVRSAVVYQADPLDSEFIQSPDVMLLAISRSPRGVTHGDCDDHVLLFCALARALGIAARAAGVMAPGAAEINHVIAVAELPGRIVEIDLCAKNGFQPDYPVKLFSP